MKIMSNREYWIWTEVFVYLHNGADHCEGEAVGCPHCAWMETVFGKKPPKTKHWSCYLCGPIDEKEVEHDTWGEYHTVPAPNGLYINAAIVALDGGYSGPTFLMGFKDEPPVPLLPGAN